jgi:hypothetical protein
MAARPDAALGVSLNASFTPERLGKPTTIAFGFQIAAPSGRVPSPLIDVALLYPENLGVASSGLGLATCTQVNLEAHGPHGCPINSRMGSAPRSPRSPSAPESSTSAPASHSSQDPSASEAGVPTVWL